MKKILILCLFLFSLLIPDDISKNNYGYNNLIGGLYLNIKDYGKVLGFVASERIINSHSIGGAYSTNTHSGNLSGNSQHTIIYWNTDLSKSKHIIPYILLGGKYTFREWTSSILSASGSIDHFGFILGIGVNLKVSKIGIGIGATMSPVFSLRAYADGHSEISNVKQKWYPNITINLYDIFKAN